MYNCTRKRGKKVEQRKNKGTSSFQFIQGMPLTKLGKQKKQEKETYLATKQKPVTTHPLQNIASSCMTAISVHHM